MPKFRDRYGITGFGLGVVMVSFFVSAIAVLILLIAFVSSASCEAQWADFPHRWDFFGGCLVEYKGTTYPDSALITILGQEP